MKGLSPVIEGVMVIAITLTISVLIGTLLSSTSVESVEKVGNFTEQKIGSIYTSFYVANVTFDSAGDCTRGVNHTLNFTVRNTGQKTIKLDSIAMESSNGTLTRYPFDRELKPGAIARMSVTSDEGCSYFISQNESYPGYALLINRVYATSSSAVLPHSSPGEYVNVAQSNHTESKPGKYLMAIWHFNNSLEDSSGYGNHGSFGGGGANYVSCLSSAFGNCIQMDGNDDYIEVSDSDSLDISNEITIEAWIYDPPPGEE